MGMKKYSLTAIGQDQPGIVSALTRPLFNRGCNIEDSSMTILEGEFAVILITALPEGVDLLALDEEINEVGRALALTVNMRAIRAATLKEKTALSNYILTLHGEDTTGIIHKTAALLAEEGINITDLETKTASKAGNEGCDTKKLYMMMMELYIAPQKNIAGLNARIKKLGEELGLTIRLRQIEDYGRL